MEKAGDEEALHKLYPHLSNRELEEARRRLDGYLELAFRIYERITPDPTLYAMFKELIAERKAKERGGAKRS